MCTSLQYGHKRPITTGLDVSGDIEAQTKYEMADHRFRFWKKQKERFASEELPAAKLFFPRWSKERKNGPSGQLR